MLVGLLDVLPSTAGPALFRGQAPGARPSALWSQISQCPVDRVQVQGGEARQRRTTKPFAHPGRGAGGGIPVAIFAACHEWKGLSG